MKIEALETIKSDGYVLDAGDIKANIPDAIGRHWCALGWAKDCEGQIATGERVILNANLIVQPGTMPQQADNLGVNNNG